MAEPNSDDVPKCSICLDNLTTGKTVTLNECAHTFHMACMESWVEKSRTCPNCVARIDRKGNKILSKKEKATIRRRYLVSCVLITVLCTATGFFSYALVRDRVYNKNYDNSYTITTCINTNYDIKEYNDGNNNCYRISYTINVIGYNVTSNNTVECECRMNKNYDCETCIKEVYAADKYFCWYDPDRFSDKLIFTVPAQHTHSFFFVAMLLIIIVVVETMFMNLCCWYDSSSDQDDVAKCFSGIYIATFVGFIIISILFIDRWS